MAATAPTSWDKRNELAYVGLHPIFADRIRALIEHMKTQGDSELITQGLRTWAEQDALFAQGRTTPGKIITKARGGYSQHCFGLAADLVPDLTELPGLQPDWNVSHPAWKRLLAAAPQFKLAEGAKWRTFPDNPHFFPIEIPSTTAELRDRYAHGGLPAVWTWFESLVK